MWIMIKREDNKLTKSHICCDKHQFISLGKEYVVDQIYYGAEQCTYCEHNEQNNH